MWVSNSSSPHSPKYSGPFVCSIDRNMTHVECDRMKGATQMPSNQNWINWSDAIHQSSPVVIIPFDRLPSPMPRFIERFPFLFVYECASGRTPFMKAKKKPRPIELRKRNEWLLLGAWCAHFVLQNAQYSISHRFGHGYMIVLDVLTM